MTHLNTGDAALSAKGNARKASARVRVRGMRIDEVGVTSAEIQNDAQRGVEAPARLFAQVASNAGLAFCGLGLFEDIHCSCDYLPALKDAIHCLRQTHHSDGNLVGATLSSLPLSRMVMAIRLKHGINPLIYQ